MIDANEVIHHGIFNRVSYRVKIDLNLLGPFHRLNEPLFCPVINGTKISRRANIATRSNEENYIDNDRALIFRRIESKVNI